MKTPFEFSETPTEICSSGLATVTRVWTTTDACGLAAAWTQTIVIVPNKNMIWGDASAYQVANLGGSVRLHGSEVPQAVLSAGPVAFLQSSISNNDRESCQSALNYAFVSGACPVEMESSVIQSRTAVYYDRGTACLTTGHDGHHHNHVSVWYFVSISDKWCEEAPTW